MPLPPIATIAACGSVITAFKSSWELSRMLKKKEQEKRVESQGRVILKDLRDAHSNGYMNRKSFDKWYDRYLGAIAEKDLLELGKIREHVNLIQRDQRENKSHVSRRSTYPPSSSVYAEEKPSRRGRAHSSDRRYSSRTAPQVYTVEEYEEERRRPSHVDTRKAQSDWYHAHTLPSPRTGEIEYTPLDESFDDTEGKEHRSHGRHRRHHGHRADSRSHTSRSHSNSTVDRGRTRSRSDTTETRGAGRSSGDDDADSESESRHTRRDDYASSSRGDGRERGAGRGR